ncbi:MAG: hypothetical protein HY033_13520 [Ignavibacteriae bacterium]|nr:hypothetical protein [Ignavibacteria bacterium]MBI3365911.1 hypothetical protein [Ignavibacteriota bacterium]
MAKGTTPKSEALTKEVLIEELSAFEKRVDAKFDDAAKLFDRKIDSKIDEATFSFKEYVDVRMKQVQVSMGEMRQVIKRQGDKMDRYFNGIVTMIEGLTGKIAVVGETSKNHERRIRVLEAGRGLPSAKP